MKHYICKLHILVKCGQLTLTWCIQVANDVAAFGVAHTVSDSCSCMLLWCCGCCPVAICCYLLLWLGQPIRRLRKCNTNDNWLAEMLEMLCDFYALVHFVITMQYAYAFCKCLYAGSRLLVIVDCMRK